MPNPTYDRMKKKIDDAKYEIRKNLEKFQDQEDPHSILITFILKKLWEILDA